MAEDQEGDGDPPELHGPEADNPQLALVVWVLRVVGAALSTRLGQCVFPMTAQETVLTTAIRGLRRCVTPSRRRMTRRESHKGGVVARSSREASRNSGRSRGEASRGYAGAVARRRCLGRRRRSGLSGTGCIPRGRAGIVWKQVVGSCSMGGWSRRCGVENNLGATGRAGKSGRDRCCRRRNQRWTLACRPAGPGRKLSSA